MKRKNIGAHEKSGLRTNKGTRSSKNETLNNSTSTHNEEYISLPHSRHKITFMQVDTVPNAQWHTDTYSDTTTDDHQW